MAIMREEQMKHILNSQQDAIIIFNPETKIKTTKSIKSSDAEPVIDDTKPTLDVLFSNTKSTTLFGIDLMKALKDDEEENFG